MVRKLTFEVGGGQRGMLGEVAWGFLSGLEVLYVLDRRGGAGGIELGHLPGDIEACVAGVIERVWRDEFTQRAVAPFLPAGRRFQVCLIVRLCWTADVGVRSVGEGGGYAAARRVLWKKVFANYDEVSSLC